MISLLTTSLELDMMDRGLTPPDAALVNPDLAATTHLVLDKRVLVHYHLEHIVLVI